MKRLFDFILALCGVLALALPLLILVWLLRRKLGSPVFFRQVRPGLHGKPFEMVKFRTMTSERGPDGQLLLDAVRLTPFGQFLRATSLDELPELWNVLKGDMSLVGPRPERQHFIDAIMEVAPHYRHLHKVRPGITSWGQVKFGYAENVEQMVRRLKYDILYIENMSLAVDLKILAYTVLIILRGDGK